MYRPKTKNEFEFDELTSCMQKSIRRSEVQLAFNCARELLANTPHYVWRRLVTIALEDVYSEDFTVLPYVKHCGEAYFALASVGFRAIDCLTAAVSSMCGFPRSRLSCDFQEALIDELETEGYRFTLHDLNADVNLPLDGGASGTIPSGNVSTFTDWITPIDYRLYAPKSGAKPIGEQQVMFGSFVFDDLKTAHGHSLNHLYSLFLDALGRQDKDECFKAIFEISLLQPYAAWLILLQAAFAHFGATTPQARSKTLYLKSCREAYFSIRLRKEGTECVLALSSAVLSLCSQSASRPSLVLHTEEWLESLKESNYRFTIPDWAHDRHTRKGRSMGRKDWKHFIEEGIKVAPETNLGSDERYKETVNRKSLDGSIRFAEVKPLTVPQLNSEIEMLKRWSN